MKAYTIRTVYVMIIDKRILSFGYTVYATGKEPRIYSAHTVKNPISKNLNALTVVTRPASDNKITVGRRSAPK